MYTIRSAIEMDRSALGEIFYRSWQVAYREILPANVWDELDPAIAEPRGEIDPRTTHVLSDGTKVFGVIVFGPSRSLDRSGWGEIYALYLLPEYIGQGWGKALLGHGVEKLFDLGFSNIHLWVVEQNTRAKRLYEQNRFRPSGDTKSRQFLGSSVTEVEYQYQKESNRS